MIDVLIGGITKNTATIEKLAKKINFRFVLVGIGLITIVKIINDQNNRIDTIEEELSELNTEGE